jgi:membrane-bound acyltransferase YfiQ involved in biofilm formation
MEDKTFNIRSTNSCKGIALIFLLWHHLFYLHPEFGPITYTVALLSKVCVAIFVILSGYGYSESIKSKNAGLFSFYKKRLVSLYSNYWFIALIFVSIGILFMGRSLQDAFTSYPYAKFLIQMTGLHRFFYREYGYNATWWYMSVIIPLIILFPCISYLTKKYGILIPFFCLLILFPRKSIFPEINTWLLPFALGIYLSQKNHIVTISNRLNTYGNWRFIMLITAIVLVAALRGIIPLLGDTKIDWLFGGLIILFIFELTSLFRLLEKVLGFLGKHLFNIFLFHTFIYYYYWSEFIYSFQNPLLIFFALLSICIVISLTIEQLKRRVYFNALIGKAGTLHVPAAIEITFQQDAPAEARTSRRR